MWSETTSKKTLKESRVKRNTRNPVVNLNALGII